MKSYNIMSLVDKDQFIGLENCTWLFSGAETPPYRLSLQGMIEYMEYRGKAQEGRDHNTFIEHACKRNLARLLNGKEENMALLSNSSEIISMLAQSLGLQAGDNVIINTLEFPSGVLPWLRLKEAGIEIRVVAHQNWRVSVEDIIGQMDDQTKLVVTSHVSYLTGARLDYKQLYQHIKQTNALLLLDVTQSLGAVEVDMNESDFIVCSSYKWLLSTHGLGILGVNPRRTQHFRPQAIGWRSVEDMFSDNRFESFAYYEDARKFELGYPSYPTIYSMHRSTQLLLDIGAEKIEQHILALGDQLIEQLNQKGYNVMTPQEPNKRAGNISIICQDGEKVAELLRRHHIYLWGGDGRLRASVHLFNDSADIEKFVSLLPSPVSI